MEDGFVQCHLQRVLRSWTRGVAEVVGTAAFQLHYIAMVKAHHVEPAAQPHGFADEGGFQHQRFARQTYLGTLKTVVNRIADVLIVVIGIANIALSYFIRKGHILQQGFAKVLLHCPLEPLGKIVRRSAVHAIIP